MYIYICIVYKGLLVLHLPPSQSCGCPGYDEHGEYIYI